MTHIYLTVYEGRKQPETQDKWEGERGKKKEKEEGNTISSCMFSLLLETNKYISQNIFPYISANNVQWAL